MPLVKALLEEIGGQISIESRDVETDPKDHGTTVNVDVKLAG